MGAKPDAVSLKVDFRNPHRDLVALADELGWAFDWRVGHLGYVQKPLDAGGESHEHASSRGPYGEWCNSRAESDS